MVSDRRDSDTWEVPTGLVNAEMATARPASLTWLDRYIPSRLRMRSAETLTRSRFFVALSLGSIVISATALPFNIAVPRIAVFLVGLSLAAVANMVILKRTAALRLAGTLLAAEVALAITVFALLVGARAFYTVLPWSLVVPLVAVLIAGVQVGALFGGICVLGHAVFYNAIVAGWFPDAVPPSAWEMFSSAALVVCSTLLGALFEQTRLTSQREQDRVQEALQESRQRYKLVVKGSYDGVWDWDLRRNEAFFSRAFCASIGVSARDLDGDPEAWLSRIHQEDQTEVRTAMRGCMDGQAERVDCEYRILRADGGERWFHLRGVPLFDRKGQAVRIAGSMTDVTARKAYESQLLHAAAHDVLTGLPNRAVFMEALERCAAREERSGQPYAVLFIDLDGFKAINDQNGHGVGDQVLKAVGERLRQCARATSMVARLGGDEFAVHVDDLAALQDLTAVANRIIAALGAPIQVEFQTFHLRVSIGIATSLKGHYAGPLEVLQGADAAMYAAKRGGGSRYAFHHGDEASEATPPASGESATPWNDRTPWS